MEGKHKTQSKKSLPTNIKIINHSYRYWFYDNMFLILIYCTLNGLSSNIYHGMDEMLQMKLYHNTDLQKPRFDYDTEGQWTTVSSQEVW